MRSSEPSAGGRRVLYLITNDISARFLHGQLAHLIEHDFEVSVGTRLSDPPAAFDDGVDLHDIAFQRQPSPIADTKALLETIRLIRLLRPQIVNASTPKAGLIGTLAAWVLRVPQRVYVVRGLRFETMIGLRRRVFCWLERLTTVCATDVVYNSASLLAVAEREGAVRPGRGLVLGAGSGNGIDISRFDDLPTCDEARAELGLARDAHVVGYVGRLTLDKGVVDLVEEFRTVEDDTIVLLVGDFEPGDPIPDTTRQLIEELPHVVHVPWVDDTRAIYPAMDVLAFPSYREGLPNVPLEAQLCGVPVVAYAATGTVDAIAEGVGGFLVPAGDRDRLRQRVRALLSDPAARRELGRNGRNWVEQRFDRGVVWSELRRVLQS